MCDRTGNMMRDMTDGPGQQPQPPQEPPTSAAQGEREVLEGRVIPSRPQPRHASSQPPPPQPPYRQPPGRTAPQAPAAGPAWDDRGEAPPAAAAPPAPPATSGAPAQDAPQGAPGMGTHRQPFARRPIPEQRQERPGRQQQQERRPRRGNPQQPPSGPAKGSEGRTPDWDGLADQEAARAARRRKRLMFTGGAVAVAVIAAAVATAVVVSGGGSDDKPQAAPTSAAGGTASQPPTPAPTSAAPAPPNPLDVLSTAATDTAPLSPASLFPGRQFQLGGRTYARTATAVTPKCATGARTELAAALTANGCRQLIRVTYTHDDVAVTLGVAVFDDTAHAAKLQKSAHYLGPLNGGGIKDFCHAVSCQMTSNAVGRYAYFSIAGLKNGKTLTKTDTAARQAANDASDFAFQRIIQRGKDAAATATP